METAFAPKCRTCYETSRDFFSLLEGAEVERFPQKSLGDLLLDIAKIDIKARNASTLPMQICAGCTQKLKSAYTFAMQAQKVNEELLDKFLNRGVRSAAAKDIAKEKQSDCLVEIPIDIPTTQSGMHIKMETECADVSVCGSFIGIEPIENAIRSNLEKDAFGGIKQEKEAGNHERPSTSNAARLKLGPIAIEETNWATEDDDDGADEDREFQRSNDFMTQCTSSSAVSEGSQVTGEAMDAGNGAMTNKWLNKINQDVIDKKQNHSVLIELIKEMKALVRKSSDPELSEHNVSTESSDQIWLKENIPITTPDGLHAFNEKLANAEFQQAVVNMFSKYAGTDGKKNGKNVGYKIIDIIVKRQVIDLYSWTGSTKVKNKVKLPFLSLRNFIQTIFKILLLSDYSWDVNKNEEFLQKITKHSKRRLLEEQMKLESETQKRRKTFKGFNSIFDSSTEVGGETT